MNLDRVNYAIQPTQPNSGDSAMRTHILSADTDATATEVGIGYEIQRNGRSVILTMAEIETLANLAYNRDLSGVTL